MAAPEALTNPHAQGPGSVGVPVPTEGPGPTGAPPAQMSMPQGGGEEAPPQAAQTMPSLFDQELKKVKTGDKEEINPFRDMDPNLPLGYTPITPRVRKTPLGAVERLGDDGKWEPLHGREANEMAVMNLVSGMKSLAIRNKEDLPRFMGAIAGTALAEMVGAGPFVAAFLAGSGQMAGGAAQQLAEGQTPSVGGAAKDLALGAAGSVIPAGVGKFLEGQAAQYAAKAAISPLVKAGGEALVQRMAAEQGAAAAAGLPPGPSVTARQLATVQALGPDAQKLYQMEWGKAAKFKEALDQTISHAMGGYEQELGIEKPNFYKVIGNVMQNHGETISRNKAIAQQISGGKAYDIDPVLSSMRTQVQKMLPEGAAIFDSKGTINRKLLADATEKFPTLFSPATREMVGVYQELYNASRVGVGLNEPGAFVHSSDADKLLEPVAHQSETTLEGGGSQIQPRQSPGLTLDEMDAYRRAFGRRANFQSVTRDEASDAYAQLHHVMSDHLDGKLIDVLKEKHPGESAALMASKDFYSRLKESAEGLQTKLEKDPENAARALIDPKNPKQTEALWSMLKPKQQDYLAGGYLNTLLDPTIDMDTGKLRVTSADNAWQKVDPKIKERLYGKEGTEYIDSLINYAKGINLKAGPSYNPENDVLTSRFIALAHNIDQGRYLKGAHKFVTSFFTKNPKAEEFITDKLSGVLMPTSEEAQKVWMSKTSKALLSKPVRYGIAPLISSDLGTQHSPIEPQSKYQDAK